MTTVNKTKQNKSQNSMGKMSEQQQIVAKQTTSRTTTRVFVFSMPAMGHINPLSCIMKHLLEGGHVASIVCWGTGAVRSTIESTGAEYRAYHRTRADSFVSSGRRSITFGKICQTMIRMSERNMQRLADAIDAERPDLIIYDEMALWTKYALLLLKKKKKPLPPAILYKSLFACQAGVFPNKLEDGLFTPTLGDLAHLNACLLRMLAINVRHGLRVTDFAKFVVQAEERLSLCMVFPELQPRAHLFDKSNKFVGLCMREEVRVASNEPEPEMRALLDEFEPLNPHLEEERSNDTSSTSKKKKLVYVSFGTIFIDDTRPFAEVLKAVGLLLAAEEENYRFVVATGKHQLERIKRMSVDVASNVTLLAFAPQIEILKRAHVFVTHCGMNSTSEAVHFGVPMVCVPLSVDQPMVAYRVADSLGLGIRLERKTLRAEQLASAIRELVHDPSYRARSFRMAQTSRRYDGVANATAHILSYFDEESKRHI